MRKHFCLAIAVIFIVGNLNLVFASVTIPYTFTTGYDEQNPARLNSNFTTLGNKFNADIDYLDGDTGGWRIFNNGALPTTNGDTQFGNFRMAFYYRDMPDTANAEDTITHGLGAGNAPLFWWFCRISPDTTVGMPHHIRSDDTFFVISSPCGSDSERILIIY